MTPEAWETATLAEMMAYLGWEDRGVARKHRLFLVNVCRHFWRYVDAATARPAIEAAEMFVDGLISFDRLRDAHEAYFHAYLRFLAGRGKRSIHTRNGQLLASALEASNPSRCRLVMYTHQSIVGVAAAFLRDIFGHRVRQVAFDARWRTSDVVGLARAIYDDRAFDRMPILADALMDAGCENEEIISHCRGDGPHVRGCWVVDMILGKE